MENLFAYGTLMYDDIMAEVAGCQLAGVPGTLRGYSRRAVVGEVYPAVVPQAGSSVAGVVYRQVPEAAWERLDRFEGEMYERQLVQVDLGDGETLLAGAYVARAEFLAQIDEAEWDVAEFLRNGKARFQEQYRGFQAL